MPQLLDRIRAFCVKFDSDAEVEDLCQEYLENFVSRTPQAIAIVSVAGTRVTGHMLGFIQQVGRKKALHVFQYEVDESLGEILKAGFDLFCDWGVSRGATMITAEAINDKIERLDRVFFGLKRHRILLRKEL